MNRFKLALLSAGLAMCLGGAAGAQQPGQGKGQGQSQGQQKGQPGQPAQPGQAQGRRGQAQRQQASLATMPVPVMVAKLGLTADQKTKIEAIRKKLSEDTRALVPKPGQQADPAARQKRNELRQAAEQQIEAILNDDQKKKATTLVAESRMLGAAGVPQGMAGEIKLSDEQKKKIADIQKETRDKLRGLSPEERRTKGRELRQENRTKIEEVLTPDQKAEIEKYRKEHPQGQGRGNRRGGGNPPA